MSCFKDGESLVEGSSKRERSGRPQAGEVWIEFSWPGVVCELRSGVGRGWNVLGMPTEHPEYWLATCLTHRNPADMSLPLARRFSYISVDVWESHPSPPLPCLNKVSLVTEARRGEVNNEGDLLLFFFLFSNCFSINVL